MAIQPDKNATSALYELASRAKFATPEIFYTTRPKRVGEEFNATVMLKDRDGLDPLWIDMVMDDEWYPSKRQARDAIATKGYNALHSELNRRLYEEAEHNQMLQRGRPDTHDSNPVGALQGTYFHVTQLNDLAEFRQTHRLTLPEYTIDKTGEQGLMCEVHMFLPTNWASYTNESSQFEKVSFGLSADILNSKQAAKSRAAQLAVKYLRDNGYFYLPKGKKQRLSLPVSNLIKPSPDASQANLTSEETFDPSWKANYNTGITKQEFTESHATNNGLNENFDDGSHDAEKHKMQAIPRFYENDSPIPAAIPPPFVQPSALTLSQPSFLEKAAQLCKRLGLGLPEYQIESQGDGTLYGGAAIFPEAVLLYKLEATDDLDMSGQQSDHNVPTSYATFMHFLGNPRGIGRVEGVRDKRQAKEEVARLVCVILELEQARRRAEASRSRPE